jgi:hypothetical protein
MRSNLLTPRAAWLLAIMAVSFSIQPALATTYILNDVSGTTSLTGFIKTDGTTGVLSNVNIVDWDLNMAVGATTFELTGPISGNNSTSNIAGPVVTATSFGLFFNFSGLGNWPLFSSDLNPPAGFLCFQPAIIGCLPAPNSSIALMIEVGDNLFVSGSIPGTGNVEIGVAETPIPAALPLFTTGLGALALMGWRRKRKSAALPK